MPRKPLTVPNKPLDRLERCSHEQGAHTAGHYSGRCQCGEMGRLPRRDCEGDHAAMREHGEYVCCGCSGRLFAPPPTFRIAMNEYRQIFGEDVLRDLLEKELAALDDQESQRRYWRQLRTAAANGDGTAYGNLSLPQQR